MGNINYLNFRKAPKDEDLVSTTREFFERVFPGLKVDVEVAACLRVTFPGNDEEEGFDYFRYSSRKIGTKGPRREWPRWAFYLLRCRLIETYGGTNRDEFDETEALTLDASFYPTFRSWLEAMHPNHVSFWDRDEWAERFPDRPYEEALAQAEGMCESFYERATNRAEAQGYPMEANL